MPWLLELQPSFWWEKLIIWSWLYPSFHFKLSNFLGESWRLDIDNHSQVMWDYTRDKLSGTMSNIYRDENWWNVKMIASRLFTSYHFSLYEFKIMFFHTILQDASLEINWILKWVQKRFIYHTEKSTSNIKFKNIWKIIFVLIWINMSFNGESSRRSKSW